MDAQTAGSLKLLKNLSIFTETYGCTYNAGDTEKLMEIARSQGCVPALSADQADAVLINTCVVIGRTEQHMYERLDCYAEKLLFVTGCLPPVAKEVLETRYPHIHIIDPDHIHACYMEVATAHSGTNGVLQIARGCNGHCTYCITRLARGKLVSFPAEDILRQAESIIKAGASEIQLTAQDTSSWGMDRNDGQRLPDLLRALCKLPGHFMIRIGMANPDTLLPLLDDFLEALQDPKIFLFLHIPVQSGSDPVLRLMGRRYTSAQYEEICTRAREAFPDIRISTDYIAGFSGETDEDAAASVEQIRRTKPGKVNITRFSVRQNTPAAKMKKIPEQIKKQRSRELTTAANSVYDANNAEMIGRILKAVVTEVVKLGSVTARDRTYQNIVVMQDIPIGTEIRVKITGHRRHYLIGELI
ncbi:MAG TPA: tRNA (N(6)-L-threonylcarbamoyladenosine(37)-C(2))-methylthiotransferase [Methanocorpusculum sp.]|jgi:threonylcarbamoyladenosine tRNA methylthiotransferase CDKAL1|uniref:tRNA (N(6)-L-threonylcarbamoyladenosine(37)-C(2))- methylthiotransferase n=1 Tax=Methanocorpusculum sp. GPch4 TaxID=2527877 RepID=UPI001432BF8D|nr:tRNA (N(6)-L-threonylcarbamoyladenosine(37)-C(2))-methylthiotransferase [Methanocorpusculum sp. GPch4]HJJ35471.1 tRNA (N(6)-L-threonylcarbamoyladenosine(37)-C(2))-methylthiotransferase [Methanocorpusculum sp.]